MSPVKCGALGVSDALSECRRRRHHWFFGHQRPCGRAAAVIRAVVILLWNMVTCGGWEVCVDVCFVYVFHVVIWLWCCLLWDVLTVYVLDVVVWLCGCDSWCGCSGSVMVWKVCRCGNCKIL